MICTECGEPDLQLDSVLQAHFTLILESRFKPQHSLARTVAGQRLAMGDQIRCRRLTPLLGKLQDNASLIRGTCTHVHGFTGRRHDLWWKRLLFLLPATLFFPMVTPIRQ